jgi:alanine dehydrogenase
MRIGVPTEIKAQEGRVGLTPAAVRELVARGHQVLVQSGAGMGSAIDDAAFAAQGASVVPGADEVYGGADMIVKVKEPQPVEVGLLRPGQLLYTYLHLAAEPALAAGLCASGATCIAYESVEDERGALPLLAPMSEVAGRLAAGVAASTLASAAAGARGVLMGGVPGVAPARVLVIGGGVAGTSAARVAVGMGADVVVLDRSLPRLRELETEFGRLLTTRFASSLAIEELLGEADAVIGTVLVRGARAPHVVRRADLARMKPGAVLVDVAIDQGGCFETSFPTTHAEPTYVTEGIVHYGVANMPGSVPVTATHALVNATLPTVLALADHGVDAALAADPGLAAGLTVAAGQVVHPVVAAELAAFPAVAPVAPPVPEAVLA